MDLTFRRFDTSMHLFLRNMLIISHQTAVLEHHLRSHNAEIVSSLDNFSRQAIPGEDEATFLVVPHTCSEQDIPSTPDTVSKLVVVTDMWIELCLHRKRYVHPQANLTSSPFRYPIPGTFDSV